MSVNISDVLEIVNSQNQWRGKEAINLIASENIQSDTVKQIESNDFMGRYAEGHPPLLNERERALLLSAIEAVDRVIIFDDSDASSLIRNIRPTIVVKGKHFEKQLLPEQEAIRESGAKLEYFPEY